MRGDRNDEMLEHLASCSRCSAVAAGAMDDSAEEPLPALRSSTAAWQREMAGQMMRAQPKSRNWWIYAAAAVLLMVAGSAALLEMRPRTEILLARAYTEARPFEYRLPDDGYGPIRQRLGAGSAFDRPAALVAAEAQIQRRLRAKPEDATLLDLKARAELLEGNYQPAIETLTQALEMRPGDADLAADLAADLGCAYAARGEAEKHDIDFGRAVEQFLDALKTQPGNGRILFNLALVYEKLSMVDQAIAAWQRAIGLHPAPGWGAEAQRHLAVLQKIQQEKKKADGGVMKDAPRFLLARRQQPEFDADLYHETFWQLWLPGASREAREAASLVARRFREQFGDASLADTQALSGQAREPLEQLASAITLNQQGQGDRAAANARTASASLKAAGLTAADLRARLELAYTLRRAARNDSCLEITEGVIATASARHYAWLSGNAHLEHALCAEGVGHAGAARAELQGAHGELERAGLGLLALRALGFVTGIDNEIGNSASVWENAPGGLRLYWSRAGSAYRAQQFLFELRLSAEALGWRKCAAVMGEGAADAAGRARNPEMEAADRADLADLYSRGGDYDDEIRELESARKLAGRLPAGPSLDNLSWALDLSRARADLASGRLTAAHFTLQQLAPLEPSRSAQDRRRYEETRGLAAVAASQWREARDAFTRIVDANQNELSAFSAYQDRMAATAPAADSYRNLAQIELLRDHDAEGSLHTWRMYLGAAQDRGDVITEAVLPAGVVVWSGRGGATRGRLVSVPVHRIEEACRRFLRLCASPASNEADIHVTGHLLYEWLLAPELGTSPARIEIDADSWLASIPFGALTDDSGRYLYESHAIEQGGEPETPQVGRDSPALIVAAPRGVLPGGVRLPVLSNAEAEASRVAQRFNRPVVLREATSGLIESNSASAQIFHFAGHGWSNGGNGALVLPMSGSGEPQFITARELARQRWTHCGLAVLSACLTAAGEERGAVNNQSLVRALLSAGARQVVAARWSVDSGATGALMNAFYEGLFAGRDAPDALRAGAVSVRETAGWSHPYYWAGFDVFAKP